MHHFTCDSPYELLKPTAEGLVYRCCHRAPSGREPRRFLEPDAIRSVLRFHFAENVEKLAHFDLCILAAFCCADANNKYILTQSFPALADAFAEYTEDFDRFVETRGGGGGGSDTEDSDPGRK
jgi:hypothetical protein